MGRLRAMKSASDTPKIILTVVGLAIYAAGTYAVVEAAGGTDVSGAHGNTPNATVPGPPASK